MVCWPTLYGDVDPTMRQCLKTCPVKEHNQVWMTYWDYQWKDSGTGFISYEIEVNTLHGCVFTVTFQQAVVQQCDTFGWAEHRVVRVGDDIEVQCDVGPFQKRALFVFRCSTFS